MRKFKFYFVFLLLLSFFTGKVFSQDFMIQGWYWDYPKTAAGKNWADTIKTKAAILKNAGFTYVWLPPLSKASFGNTSNGYDPKDLYDLGEYDGPTGFGTRAGVDSLITEFNTVGIKAVADVVYNHRDGGSAEQNSALKTYLDNYSWDRANTGYNPFPYDRMRFALPIGGSTGNGAGDYYFKFRTASWHSRFDNYEYNIYMETKTSGWKDLTDQTETEPNGGGDCGQANNEITLGRNMKAVNDSYSGCRTDEFHLNLTTSDFNSAGDTIFIYLNKSGSSDYSDIKPYGIWSGTRSADIVSEMQVQTYTNFNNMPSGQGAMTFANFKPNNTNSTKLDGDWDWLWFFYDYDQNVATTKTALFDWTRWLWTNVGIRGLRMDAVKHFPYEFVGDLLDNLHTNGIDPGMVVGEFYDSGVNNLKYWIQQVYSYMDAPTSSAIQVRLFDFALRQALKDACDNMGYDVRNVFTSGMVDGGGMSGSNVVTFLNNHDFRDAGQAISNDPILAYAYILTNNQIGIPCVFYPDYFNVSSFSNTNLHVQIDKLIDVHKNYIYGSSSRTYLTSNPSSYNPYWFSGYNTTTLAYQLKGIASGLDVIVAINFAGEALDMWVDVDRSNASIVEGTTFSDKIGNATNSYCTVSSGRVNLKLPARSYAVWVQDATPAPVELTDFTAEAKKNEVVLKWNTATEVNNYGFNVERKTLAGLYNKEIDWSKIGFVNGYGNSNSPKNYSFIDVPTGGTNFSYRLQQIDLDGKFEYSPVVNVELETPIVFSLAQNFPNPFNPQTIINYNIAKVSQVSLKIYDILGREVATLVNEIKQPGFYAVPFSINQIKNPYSSTQLSSGIYFYKLTAGDFVETKKMILAK